MTDKDKENKKPSKKKTVSKETPGYFEEIRSRREQNDQKSMTPEDLANIDGD